MHKFTTDASFIVAGVPPRPQPYSPDEHRRIINALNTDLRAIHSGGDACPLTVTEVLLVHLLVLAVGTGRNAQPLLELRRDSVQDHPAPGRKTITTFKRRGRHSHATSFKASTLETDVLAIPSNIADHFQFVVDYTAPMAGDADSETAQFVFLWRATIAPNAGRVRRLKLLDVARTGFAEFVRRHALVDDAGEPLSLQISRLRPTYATDLYARTGDIRVVQQELGHASAATTAQR